MSGLYTELGPQDVAPVGVSDGHSLQYGTFERMLHVPGADVGASAEGKMLKASAAEAEPERVRQEQPRLLIVEDDEPVRVTLEIMLRPHYAVETVASLADAKTKIRHACESDSTSQDYDMVLCDFALTDGTAEDLYTWMEREAPGYVERFGLMTGGTSRSSQLAFLSNTPAPQLEKPFSTASVISAVSQSIARRNAA